MYTGAISVNNVTGVITLANAAPPGLHTITIQAVDECFADTEESFPLSVANIVDANGFE